MADEQPLEDLKTKASRAVHIQQDRLERSQALLAILGEPDASVERVAQFMSWADAYQERAVDIAVETVYLERLNEPADETLHQPPHDPEFEARWKRNMRRLLRERPGFVGDLDATVDHLWSEANRIAAECRAPNEILIEETLVGPHRATCHRCGHKTNATWNNDSVWAWARHHISAQCPARP